MVDLNPLHYINRANHWFGDKLASRLEFLGITDPAVDPDGVREIAKKWRHLAKGLEDASAAAERALSGVEWEGKAAKAFHKRSKSARKSANEMAHSLREGAKALDDFADKAHELLSEIGVMLAEIAEFEIAGLALSILTAGASEVASNLMAGERALKVVALVGRIEEEGTALGSVVRGVMEVIRGVERALQALKEIRGVAQVGKMAAEGAKFSAFQTLLEDPGAFKDPDKLAGILTEGALMGVGFGVLGKALGKGLKSLKPSELARLAKALKFGGNDLSRLKLRPGEAEELEAAIQAAEKECKLDPIDVATGTVLLPQTDLELPGALPLLLERTHLSSYRWGGWFGPSWASTLDQRLQAADDGITYAAPDGSRLVYPRLPPDASEPVYPETGPRIPLAWDTDTDGAMRITNASTGLTYIFHSPQPTGDGDAVDLPLQVIENPHGHRITVHYSEAGIPVEVSHSGGYRVALDHHAELARITALRALDPERPGAGGTVLVSYGYDDEGRLSEVRNASGQPLCFTYDEAGRITSWTDRNANSYSYTYDEHGRVVRTEGSGGFLTGTLTYDDATRTTTVTNALGYSTRYQHNEALRLIAETDPLGNTRHQEWDAEGRLIALTDALGHTTRHRYNEQDLLTSVVHPDDQVVFAEYDDRGLPVAITGPDGSVWRQVYDGHGNRTSVTNPIGATTHFAYGTDGLLEAVTDPLGRATRFRYNRAGLPAGVTSPQGATTSYTYDFLGRQTTVTDPSGNVTRLEWTTDGHMARRTAPDGSSESWTYDAEGNCTSHIDASGGTTRFEYGDFDMLTARTGPDDARYTFTYDTELRLTGVTNPQGLKWDYEYDAAGRLLCETDFDGRTLTYTYDAAGRFVSRTNPVGQTITHRLDPVGRILAKDADGSQTTYAYDTAGHLIEARTETSTLVLERDALGRVLAETVDGRTTHYTHDTLGRRTTRTTPLGAVSHLSWDDGDMVTGVSLAGHELARSHDVLGRETTRVFGPRSAPVTLHHAWDQLNRRSSQRLTTTDRTLRSRAYEYRADSSLIGIEDRLANEHRSVSLDSVGRPLAITADRWTETYTYDPAGNQTSARWPDSASHPEARGERTYTGTRIRSAGHIRYEYDAAGRTTLRQKTYLSRKPDTWRYEYDTEDRLVSCTTPDGTKWTYTFDPLGRRTAKHRTSADGKTCQQTIHFTWDGTELAEQTDLTTGVITTWEYDGEHPIAQFERKITASDVSLAAATHEDVDSRFFAIITDLVGTPTELVDEHGDIAWYTRATLWGITSWNRDASAYTPLRFPGQYADPETGLHYNFFRQYDPETARYTTPDPFGLTPAPNPVAYVSNPETWSDPLGLVPKACKMDGYSWDGSVRFGKLDSLDRPTGIWASLRKEMLDQPPGSEAGRITPPGWRGNGDAFNEARGHLLARILGGPGKGRLGRQNLVTLTQNPSNSPVMSKYEAMVYAAVNDGEIVQYSVKPVYAGTNPIPLRLELRAYGNRGFRLEKDVDNPASGVRTAIPGWQPNRP
ncbi:DUF6531 domain-containing protein [Streptomyces sp. NPDC001435]|uniref:DUF6531 domain-containing protein n=1 Tax=unclassified Streptomyces TaxID=2593676 RepID=UPI00369F4ABB